MAQIVINSHQSRTLVDVLEEHNDDSPVFFTGTDVENRPLTVAFSLATVTIDPNGDIDEV